MNCTYNSIIKDSTGLEEMYVSEKFACSFQTYLIDFTYVYIFQFKQSSTKMIAVIFACVFLFANGTQLLYENFFCQDIIMLVDYFKMFEFVGAFVFYFILSFGVEFQKIYYERQQNFRPPYHSFSLNISTAVMFLTIGAGLVYLLTKNKIRIPYYSTYLSLAALMCFLLFILLCVFVGEINNYLLLFPFLCFCFYVYFLFKFADFDKFTEEKFRTTVFKDDYDLAYYHEPLTKEQLEKLNKKREQKKINLKDLSDSEEDDDEEILQFKQKNFQKILIQQLEDEFKEQPTLIDKIESGLSVNKNQNLIVYSIERWILIGLCFFLPSQSNFLTKTHLKMVVQYFGFCIAFMNLPEMNVHTILACSFFATIIYYSCLYFFQEEQKKIVSSIVTVFVVSNAVNFISFIFLDIFLFLAFFFNFSKIDYPILRGVFRVVPVLILIYVLSKKDRLVFGYAILMVTLVSSTFVFTILRCHNLIMYGLTSLDLNQIYKNKKDARKVGNQFGLIFFFAAFLIVLHLVYLYIRKQIGNQNFGLILITVGFAYLVANIVIIL